LVNESQDAKKLIAAAKALIPKRIDMPSLQQLFIEIPLYAPVVVDDQYLTDLRRRTYQFDAYCYWCGRESVFKEVSVYTGVGISEGALELGSFEQTAKCQRNASHKYEINFKLLRDKHIVKVGQYPSLADISGADLQKYRPLLRGGYFEELTRANGLISHGVGIGSFVYLRRIFEKLIADHRAEREVNSGAIEGFDQMRMDAKIAALKDVLPPALVKNRSAYGILSSGIHSLTEVECKLYFPVVKAAILQILQQDFEARERMQKERDLEAEIEKIAQTVKAQNAKGVMPPD